MDSPSESAAPRTPPAGGTPRLRRAQRDQMQWAALHLDGLVPADHQVRAVWAYVERMDLSKLYAAIRAVEGHVGRSPIDPKILLCLWLYATLDGVGSARALADLCEQHHVYQWICGGVSVNYHTLADFRTAHVELLDAWLTDSVASLRAADLVTLERVAQDGMRVRASAGAGSFHRKATLEEHRRVAREQVEALRRETKADPAATRARQAATRRRAAEEQSRRVDEALRQLESLPRPSGKKAKEPRASSTDPDARVMKMADGGFRPAYNLQFATDTASQVIVHVDVTNRGSDQGELVRGVEGVQRRYGRTPRELLVDGGYAKKEDIEAVSALPEPVTVYAPVQKPKCSKRDPYEPLPDDSEAVAAWRRRMGTKEAKAIYRERAATAECVNAQARNRGLRQFVVRGLKKARAIGLLFALAHNIMRGIALGYVPATG